MPFIPNIGPGELILILIIALVVLGPGKLPDVAQSLGKSLREFRKAATDVSDAARVDAPAPTPPTTPPPSPNIAPVPAAPAAPEPPAPNTLASASEPNTLVAPAVTPADADGGAAAPVPAGSTSPNDSGDR